MMPLFGLAAFLFLPWAVALPLYLAISAVSLLIYAKIMKAQRAPVATGREGMIGGGDPASEAHAIGTSLAGKAL